MRTYLGELIFVAGYEVEVGGYGGGCHGEGYGRFRSWLWVLTTLLRWWSKLVVGLKDGGRDADASPSGGYACLLVWLFQGWDFTSTAVNVYT
jgi:hypothetical protein